MTKIALVGAGYMAAEHARAFAAQPDARIVGVSGRNPERALALAEVYGVKSFGTIDSLWEVTQADIVVVSVNELSMEEVCTQVFRYPWKVLLEKPVGVDLNAARRIQSLAVAAAAVDRTWVALNRRSYASTLTAQERIGNETSRLVTVLDQQDMEAARALGKPEVVVSNYMYANSIHLVDYFQIFCRGKLEQVQVTVPWKPEAPGYVAATLQYDSGDVGLYHAVWNGPGPWAVAVATPSARYEMRPLETLTVQARGERRVVSADLGSVDTEFKPGLYRQAAEMLRPSGGHAPRLATLSEAVNGMKLCADLYGLI